MTKDGQSFRKVKQEVNVPKGFLVLLNQIFEIERKLEGAIEFEKIERNISRMKDAFGSIFPGMDVEYENPMGQPYDDTRSDLEAHIVGEMTNDLVVVDVIKPTIRFRSTQPPGTSLVVQKGIVSVESKSLEKE